MKTLLLLAAGYWLLTAACLAQEELFNRRSEFDYLFIGFTGTKALARQGTASGVVTGATQIAYQTRSSMYFRGSFDQVGTFTSAFSVTGQPRTVSFWMATTNTTRTAILGTRSSSASDGWQFDVNLTAGKVSYFHAGGTVLTSTTLVTNGSFYHVAAIYDGNTASNCYLYVNGKLEASATKCPPDKSPLKSALGAGFVASGASFFSGYLADIFIFNSALSTAEIKSLYLQGLAPK